MSKGLIVIAVLVVIVLALFGQYIGVKNNLVAKDQAVKSAWSQVDVVLQRRADLIPNLVETVKGYAQQEVTVFGDIAKARSALLSAQTPTDKIAANGQLDGAIGRLLVIVENYPQLKSNENFQRTSCSLTNELQLVHGRRDTRHRTPRLNCDPFCSSPAAKERALLRS